jgi:BirA family biotin operon repressor/biotin-[acetyl-CoA-carboxylase] ligase
MALEGLSLAVGVVIVEVLEQHGLDVRLKWPNDVLMVAGGQRRKLAGILLELGGDVNGPCEVILGIGLNVEADEKLRAQVDQPIAAVHDQAPAVSRNQLAAQLIEKLLELLPRFEDQGFAPWQAAWNQRNAHAGKEIVVMQGAGHYTAINEGVDERGYLIVRCGQERLRLAGGETSLRERS